MNTGKSVDQSRPNTAGMKTTPAAPPNPKRNQTGRALDTEAYKTWSEVAKNVAQILALLVAGIWTYEKFVRTESPLHTPKGKTSGELIWEATADPSICQANFILRLENTGTQPFTVSSVKVSAWLFEPPISPDTPLAFLDEAEILRSKPDFERSFQNIALCREYAPQAIAHQMFSWFLRKLPRKALFVRGQLISDQPLGLQEYRWSGVCPSSIGS